MTPATYHPTHSRTLPPPDQGCRSHFSLYIENDSCNLSSYSQPHPSTTWSR